MDELGRAVVADQRTRLVGLFASYEQRVDLYHVFIETPLQVHNGCKREQMYGTRTQRCKPRVQHLPRWGCWEGRYPGLLKCIPQQMFIGAANQ